jgi:hypothetical protein
MVGVEREQHFGDEADAQGRRRPQAYATTFEAREFSEFAPHRLGVGEHAPRERQQRLPRDGQRAAAASPAEQFGTQVVLERRDLPAQGWLCEIQALGGPGEVALPRHFDEALQLIEIHSEIVSL